MNIEEVRKAAAEFSVSVKEFTERQMTSEELVNHHINERVLARWAVDELARRDAEAAERALPITEEWLRVVMPDRRRSDERIWHSLHIKNDLYETHLLVRHVELSRFWAVLVQALEHDETLTEKVAFGDLKNRGQLLDLLAALKGGES